ncbi:hypothetical protein [Lentzea roselyniae]|uniref:hypothetical protein n=1 Tax=Lentzea roselyniae TaxID=531940 RepID=UPI0031F8180F
MSLAGVAAITAVPAASAVVIYNKRYTSERLCHSNARQIALQGATILVNCRYEGAPAWSGSTSHARACYAIRESRIDEALDRMCTYLGG